MKIQSTQPGIRTRSYVSKKIVSANFFSIVKLQPAIAGEGYEKALRKIEDLFMNLAVKTKKITVTDIAGFFSKPMGEGRLGFLLVNKNTPPAKGLLNAINDPATNFGQYFDRIVADPKIEKLSLPPEDDIFVATKGSSKLLN